jgi:hypothetical protein
VTSQFSTAIVAAGSLSCLGFATRSKSWPHNQASFGAGEAFPLLCDDKIGVQAGRRIFASPDIEIGRFDDPLLRLWVPVLEFVIAKRESECLALTWFERDALESLQLPNRSRCGSEVLMDVNLHNGIAGDGAGIGYVYLHLG